MFFKPSKVAFIDWQNVGVGPCVYDLAYFLSGVLDENDMFDRQEHLLQFYHSKLVQVLRQALKVSMALKVIRLKP